MFNIGGHIVSLVAKLFPLPASYVESGPSLPELTRVYRKWYLLSFLIFVVAAAILSYVWGRALDMLFVWNAARFGPAVFHLRVSGKGPFFLAFLWACIASESLAPWLYRGLLRERFELYVRYLNLKNNCDKQRMERWLRTSLIGLFLLLTIALLNWHVVVRQDDMLFQSWLGVSNSRQTYNDVDDIRTAPKMQAPNGNVVERREYEIQFADGTQWSTSITPADLEPIREPPGRRGQAHFAPRTPQNCASPRRFSDRLLGDLPIAEKQAIARFISARSGKPIRELAILE